MHVTDHSTCQSDILSEHTCRASQFRLAILATSLSELQQLRTRSVDKWISENYQELQIASWLYIECSYSQLRVSELSEVNSQFVLSLWLVDLSLQSFMISYVSGLRNLNEFIDGSWNTRASNLISHFRERTMALGYSPRYLSKTGPKQTSKIMLPASCTRSKTN